MGCLESAQERFVEKILGRGTAWNKVDVCWLVEHIRDGVGFSSWHSHDLAHAPTRDGHRFK